MWRRASLAGLILSLFIITFNFPTGLAAKYYSKQTDFTEIFVPLTEYRWNHDDLKSCIYKEAGVNIHIMCGQSWRCKNGSTHYRSTLTTKKNGISAPAMPVP